MVEGKKQYPEAYDAKEERKRNRSRLWNRLNKNHIRSQRLLVKYGITLEDYELMLENQNHTCKICGTGEPRGVGAWKVDHCHATGKVRGLLCNNCNVGLGYFKDNTVVLASAIKYLNESSEATNESL